LQSIYIVLPVAVAGTLGGVDSWDSRI
jgi:hypothetical protein